MTFSALDKLKALAIVNIFETGDPFGDTAALAVLDDGAGISYGTSQFTHRSGSLLAVVENYLNSASPVGRRVIEDRLPLLRNRSKAVIAQLAADETFKKALRAAGLTSEMRAAQQRAAADLYLRPAIGACEGSGFQHPLSLAVIYDSMNHGSWEKIRDRVRLRAGEKEWITEYVRERHKWLSSNPRLKATAYRTKFFLGQIAIGDWGLSLPLVVHGARLTQHMFAPETIEMFAAAIGEQKDSAVEPTKPSGPPAAEAAGIPSDDPHKSSSIPASQPPQKAQPPNEHAADQEGWLDAAESRVYHAAGEYDRAEAVVKAVLIRKDAAKSLWTTVAGTAWQSAWAIFGFAAGMPREIWFAVALAAAVFTLFYLYRQIALGRIREGKLLEGVEHERR